MKNLCLISALSVLVFCACNNNTGQQPAKLPCNIVVAHNGYDEQTIDNISFSSVIEIDTSVGGVSCLVESEDKGMPVKDAKIVLKAGIPIMNYTDSTGTCHFAGITVGDYTMTVEATGYECIQLSNVHIGSGWVRTIRFRLNKP